MHMYAINNFNLRIPQCTHLALFRLLELLPGWSSQGPQPVFLLNLRRLTWSDLLLLEAIVLNLLLPSQNISISGFGPDSYHL